jgi:uncharacterized Zn finger protein
MTRDLRPVWLQLSCARCERRAAAKLSDVLAHHRADYAVYRCPNCNAVRTFERFADGAAFAWRRRTLYQEIQAALERLTPARLARDPHAAVRPRERMARCVRELETLDRYHGRNPPRCDECGVLHEPLEGERPYDYAATCSSCGEHPMRYTVVFAAAPGPRAAFAGGVACPACGAGVDVTGLVEGQGRARGGRDTVRCGGCGLALEGDADVRSTATRTLVRSLTLSAEGTALSAARRPEALPVTSRRS